ncbi:MAG: pyrrolo-quinoline quinone, partial [Acidobacteria bacterium]|nr:pyrrolo-quinoline quinone [Acidobacteriota bacterium]
MTSRLRVAAGLAAVLAAGVTGTAQITNFTPVTDEILRNPKPEDWIHWRRTPDAWGYSPLEEINTENVRNLRLVWSWALEDGSQQTTPLVYN